MSGITRYLMIGEESEFGVEAQTYAETLDPESVDIDNAGDDKLIYEGMSGVDRIVALGQYSTEGSITLPVDDKATAWFWKWALGGYTVTGDQTNGYTHTFFPKRGALMPSFSAKVGKDIFEHIFLGNVIESIELSIENEWASMTVNTLGMKDKKGVLADQVNFTEGKVFTAPLVTLDKNGTDMSTQVNTLTLTVETGANVEDSMGFASRFPKKAFQGSMVVELELELAFDNLNELMDFWGGDMEPSSEVLRYFSYTLHLGENYDIIFPKMIYTASSQPVEGRDHITQTVTARALYDNVQQEGPIIVSITNDKPNYGATTD